MVFFRSEKMVFCQMVLHHESAFECLVELGYLGKVQFVNVYEADQEANMQFVNEVKRCAEMEIIIKHLQGEIQNSGMRSYYYPNVDQDEVPKAKDLPEIESVLLALDRELTDVVAHCNNLQTRKFFLVERRQVMLKTQDFLTGARNTETQITSYDSLMMELLHDSTEDQARRARDKAGPLNFFAGSIPIKRFPAFELMIWRISRGNAYVKHAEFEIAEDVAKRNQQSRYKYAFIVVFMGDELRDKIRKACQGFQAKLYTCPEKQADRLKELDDIAKEINDVDQILRTSCEHKRRVLTAATIDLYIYRSKIRKIQAVYAELNRMATVREFKHKNKYLQAECWIPARRVPLVRAALLRGAQRAAQGDPGMAFPPILNEHHHTPPFKPPTKFHTNKFTRGFQALVDAYGIAAYGELNPAPYTIITFPFLFAVMFGDVGHGILMSAFAYLLIAREKKIEHKQKEATKTNEIFDILFAGRYIVLLMGLFSIYTGLIYNDFLSKTVNIFGSSWRVNFTAKETFDNDWLTLDPTRPDNYRGVPYLVGVDPIWHAASDNAIIVDNSLKMKVAIILGVAQMLFGLTLSAVNVLNHKIDLYLVVLPQMVFMVCLFFYLCILMFHKWYWFGGHNPAPYSPGCAPSILITFIDMMLMKNSQEAQEGCLSEFYPGQIIVQHILLFTALIAVPILLCGKPLHFMYQHRRIRNIKDSGQKDRLRRSTMSSLRKSLIYNLELPESSAFSMRAGEEEEKLSEIWIHQGIHTIESVLGSVSHTASYLRLWALSLAHNQLSHVLWNMVLAQGLTVDRGYFNSIIIFVAFAFFAVLTIAILVVMEGLSAFLHTLRLHWVEFQSKFYLGTGEPFVPFRFVPSRKIDAVV